MKLRSGSESNGSGPGARKKTERCIAKEAPFLIDAPLSVGSRTDQRVIAKEASSKATKRCIAKEASWQPTQGYIAKEAPPKLTKGYIAKVASSKLSGISPEGACLTENRQKCTYQAQ